MQENRRNKEPFALQKPQGFRTIRFHFTAEAIEWLARAMKDNGGNTVSNHALFYDLLSRMRLTSGRDDSFRRPQELQAGQLQLSETGLAEEWNIGRKAGLDSGKRFQSGLCRLRDLHRGLDGHAGQLCQPLLRYRPEWHLNSF